MHELKAVYTITEWATLAGMSRFRMGRWLAKEGVPTYRVGKTNFVSLSAFRIAFPEAWESILLRRMVRPPLKAHCPACGGTVVVPSAH